VKHPILFYPDHRKHTWQSHSEVDAWAIYTSGKQSDDDDDFMHRKKINGPPKRTHLLRGSTAFQTRSMSAAELAKRQQRRAGWNSKRIAAERAWRAMFRQFANPDHMQHMLDGRMQPT